jgi:hypothetical protein
VVEIFKSVYIFIKSFTKLPHMNIQELKEKSSENLITEVEKSRYRKR